MCENTKNCTDKNSQTRTNELQKQTNTRETIIGEKESEMLSETGDDIESESESESETECEQDERENERQIQKIIQEMEIEYEI